MAAKTQRILVIGGPAAGGFGVKPGQGFVEQFVRRLIQSGQRVQVEYHTPLDISSANLVLPWLYGSRYDLILLELGHSLLPRPSVLVGSVSSLVRVSANLATSLRINRFRLFHMFGRVALLKQLETQLTTLLTQLRPFRHKVILLTPIPHREPVAQWLCERSRPLFQALGEQHGISVFDTHPLIRCQSEYFLDNDPRLLSAVSHEIIGSYLHAFYQALPTVIETTPVARPEK
ncbi:hypothetical protein DYU11_03245 [Fibrisoma montanum]|uniref:SGNH/GDSL hydrolase family protein n=1 Tax=Fibrisoma montanum TaxID=2305895 RepID=A0A418MIU5_9BACT|nr:hypothetical protein [Fibrisoma montanum]RIV27342.1 hypothetical protein DYU11_03245 [Fibrisoma montanum]